MKVRRLEAADQPLAERTFAMMSEVFEEAWQPLGDHYLQELLSQPTIWVYTATDARQPIGGLVAHELAMTRAATTELLVYDLAVRADHQRRGVGRALVQRLLTDAAAAGVEEMWVPADNDDQHALDFYRRTGGTPQAVTVFTYSKTLDY